MKMQISTTVDHNVALALEQFREENELNRSKAIELILRKFLVKNNYMVEKEFEW